MNDDTYNGWANRATWLVNLWLSNEPHTDELAREWTREAIGDAEAAYGHSPFADTDDDRRHAAYVRSVASDHLRENVSEWVTDDIAPASLASDLLGDALASVDWGEVVDAFAPEEVEA